MTDLIFEGNCWKFGHNIPTDAITPTHIIMKGLSEMAQHILESVNPEFSKNGQRGDIIVAGRNLGCSSEEVFRSVHIPPFAEMEINRSPDFIHRPVQIGPPAFHPYIHVSSHRHETPTGRA